MRVLILGSEGNIGKALVPYLQKCGHEVMGADRTICLKGNYTICDINNYSSLQDVFVYFKPEVVFNLAAIPGRIVAEQNKDIALQTNVNSLLGIIKLCEGLKLIHFSTSEIYGNLNNLMHEKIIPKPNNFYGLTKYIGEQIIEYFDKNDIIIIRPFMIYGEDEVIGIHRSCVINFITNILQGKKIVVHKDSYRSWLNIKDAVMLMEKALYVHGPLIINIGNKNGYFIQDVAKRICEVCKVNPDEYIEVIELPERMTLSKVPDLHNQEHYLKYEPVIDIMEVLPEMITKIASRL